MANQKTESSQEKTLKDLVDKTNAWYSSYNEHIIRALNYLNFLYVDQWELGVRQSRESQSRPTMQFNKLVPLVRSILGDQRENSPQPEVRGVGANTPQASVDLKTGLLRQINYESDSDVVYQIASKQMLECGWGAARVIMEYEDENSFYQCLKIKSIPDFQAAFWDPCAQEPDRSDGDYAGVYTLMSMDSFKKQYPDVENPESAPSWSTNWYFRWADRESIVIAEIYTKEYFTKQIAQMSDGKTLDLEDAKEAIKVQDEMLEANPDAPFMGYIPIEIVNQRDVRDYKIKHRKFIANKILEETDYPGRLLPIPYFEGDSVVINGERIPIPYVQDCIDTQKLINFVGSDIAYSVLLSRKEKIFATPDNMKGFEDIYRNPDQVQGALPYNPDNMTREKPFVVDPPVFNPQLLSIYQNATQDLMQITGSFDEMRGNETNAISGKAIDKRQQASSKPANIYNDNWKRGIKAINKICLDLAPHVYDTERCIMIMNDEGHSEPVQINQPGGFKMNQDGEIEQEIINDMLSGKYDVEIRIDGSFDSQRQEALNILLQLSAINPDIGNLIPDLIAENSGLENTQQLIKRLKTLLPPDILAQEQGKPPPEPPPPPPPPPEVLVQMQKNQNEAKTNEIREKELFLQEQKLMNEAKAQGLQNFATIAKAQAEIEKAQQAKETALINHAATTTKAKSDLLSTIQDAQTRRAALDEQSNVLRSTDV